MNVLSKIRKKLKKSFNSDKSRTLYILGVVLFLIALLLNYLLPDWQILSSALLLFASCLLMIGFLIWHISFLKITWNLELGKVAISIAHIVILLIATVFARNLLTLSLGLPGKDFQISLSFLTLILYLPIWLGVISIIFGVYFYIQGLFISDNSTKSGHSGHVLGSIGTLLFLYFLFLISNNNESLHSMVRLLAFYCDYESAPNYPDTKQNERICFHDNGVISSAWNSDGNVVINIKNFDAK